MYSQNQFKDSATSLVVQKQGHFYIGDAIWQATDGDVITLDGATGVLDLEPSAESISEFRAIHDHQQRQQSDARQTAQTLALTADGQRIEVLANIATPGAAVDALAWGAEGVGLFRTEFLFLDRSQPPSEEEQYSAYRQVIETLGERRCLIRTADIGGDKRVPYLSIETEANPFLGWRGTRLL